MSGAFAFNLEMMTMDEFEKHAARAFFASAWADMVEESGASLQGEIMDQMPDEIDPAAIHAARKLRIEIERMNGKTVAAMLSMIEECSNGDRPETMEYFGHYAAMQAMGHGVGLHDAFGSDVYRAIRVPYIGFGSCHLERDYTA